MAVSKREFRGGVHGTQNNVAHQALGIAAQGAFDDLGIAGIGAGSAEGQSAGTLLDQFPNAADISGVDAVADGRALVEDHLAGAVAEGDVSGNAARVAKQFSRDDIDAS